MKYFKHLLANFIKVLLLSMVGYTSANSVEQSSNARDFNRVANLDDGASTLSQSEAKRQSLKKTAKEGFKEANKHFSKENYHQALPGFYQYMRVAELGDENYEWAHFFWGVSLEKLGLSHAASDAFSALLNTSSNSKIVNYILEYFDATLRNHPYDYALIVEQVLNARTYDVADVKQRAVVHYYQGVHDWQSGFIEWGKKQFLQIPDDSYYFYKAKYHIARSHILNDEIDAALKLLNDIILMPEADDKLIDLALWTTARLLYEKGEYDASIAHYKRIKTPVVEQASFLLEQAWGYFKQDNPRKAMGLLYAFEAPSFERFFSPEFYVLKSFIYKSVCNYDSALDVVDQFRNRYGDALTAIHDRKGAANEKLEHVLSQIMLEENIEKRWQFIQMLESESKIIGDIHDKDSREYLKEIYAMKLAQHTKDFRHDIDSEFHRVANSLLQYEEEIDLIRYEVGIDKYQRVSDIHYESSVKQNNKEPKNDRAVIYTFQGEYWNDELDNYQVQLSNMCSKNNNWDVFFK